MRSWFTFCTIFTVGCVSHLAAQVRENAWNVLTDAALHAKSPDHRKEAVAAVSSIGPAPEAVQLLESILHDDSEAMVRQAAAAALGDMKAIAAAPALKAALNDPAGDVAFSAAKALWDLGDPEGKATFVEILTGERKGQSFVGGAMSDARRTMRDPKKLAYLGVKEASGAVFGPLSMGISMTHDAMKSAGSGRAMAVQYMAKDCDARAIQLFEWALKEDGSWLVKAASAQGIGKCNDTKAIPLLQDYIADSHEPLKYQASAAIVRLSLNQEPQAATASVQHP